MIMLILIAGHSTLEPRHQWHYTHLPNCGLTQSNARRAIVASGELASLVSKSRGDFCVDAVDWICPHWHFCRDCDTETKPMSAAPVGPAVGTGRAFAGFAVSPKDIAVKDTLVRPLDAGGQWVYRGELSFGDAGLFGRKSRPVVIKVRERTCG